jgi:hypothetical protein
MRHIFHEILARYVDGEQHAFEATSRELWPEPRSSWHPPVQGQTGGQLPERARRLRVQRELESHN